MNKQYMVDEEGRLTIIKDNGEIVTREFYTNVTDNILCLENVIETLENQMKYFSKQISKLNNSIKSKLKIIRYLDISLILLIFALLILGIATYSKLYLIIAAISIPVASIIKKIENNIINKEKIERDIYKQKASEREKQINKINKKIHFLTEKQEIINAKQINEPIEISPTEEYIIDPSNYFVESYLIARRTHEISKKQIKIKKKIKSRNTLEYEL